MTQDAAWAVESGGIPVAPSSRMEIDAATLSIRLRDERDVQEIVGGCRTPQPYISSPVHV